MDTETAKDRPLKEDTRLLGRVLGDVLRAQTGEAGFARVEAIRQTAIRFRRAAGGDAADARDELAAKRAKLADYLVKHGAMASRSETPVVPVPADPVDQPGRTIVSAKGALDLVIAMAADGRYMDSPLLHMAPKVAKAWSAKGFTPARAIVSKTARDAAPCNATYNATDATDWVRAN